MTCAQGLLRLLWGGGPKLECYGTDCKAPQPAPAAHRRFAKPLQTRVIHFAIDFLKMILTKEFYRDQKELKNLDNCEAWSNADKIMVSLKLISKC